MILPHSTPAIPPGFLVLHSNRSEDLAQTLIAWLGQHPLAPLEEEVVLVQSSGMAEWFKMAVAQQLGVCGATRVELPGRFVWRAYRQVLGAQAVPRESALDKLPMVWRLMQVLPRLLTLPEFAPMARYLGSSLTTPPAMDAQTQERKPSEPAADERRMLQLAGQLADLFDQYQNYRTDWLQNWASAQDVLTDPAGHAQALPADQRWQPALWRAVLDTLSPAQRSATRPDLHRQFLDRLQGGENLATLLPRRLVVFGMSHIPGAMLQTLDALARHSQVILAVPNPCRFYWGDIMEGRALLRTQRQRHARREGHAAQSHALQDMHLHAHPLLAAWGRQSRDFVCQLDAFDDAVTTARAFPALRLDLFDEAPETSETPMLTRIQHRIRDLEPLHVRHDDAPLAAGDRSVVFHAAHSAVRELEVLHDQLLALLASNDQTKPLNPRDIVVMVPDVQHMAPAIRAVFGQYPRHDKRFIAFDIADLSAKSSSPVIQALVWLLDMPLHRCGVSEVVNLLEVPSVAQRFGIDAEKLPQLTQWMMGAGIRWGLHAEQRAQLDLAACGDQNSAWFGLQRMLLGYAAGSLHDLPDPAGWQDIEPYTEVGGLDAALAGSLAHVLQALGDWWQRTQNPVTPAAWCAHAQWLLAAVFQVADEEDAPALAALQAGLSHWLHACEQAGFEQPVGLAALRQGWLDALQEPSLAQRFRAGGVTFCTLMPMRAIPFEVVCLLGMNDGDYPRRAQRSDFDLMGQRGMFRPGDRSRQHDDRQLMLEALLSARRVLYVSWTGRSVRDNTEQAPSVLVSQLRDYIAAAWGQEAVQVRTTAHPLQPFSRRYFETPGQDGAAPLLTYAREWRSAHAPGQSVPRTGQADVFVPDAHAPLDVLRLMRFFRNPVSAYFKERLGVAFWSPDAQPADAEAFGLDGLQKHQLLQSQTRHWPAPNQCEGLTARVVAGLDAVQRAGDLPMQGLGQLKKAEILGTLTAMAQAWTMLGQDFALAAERVSVVHSHQGVVVRDWLDAVYQNAKGVRAWVRLEPSKITRQAKGRAQPRPEKLLRPWLQALLAAAAGHSLHGRVVGQDGQLHICPMPEDLAQQVLDGLLAVWLQGQQAPLPLPFKTALALASGVQSKDDAHGMDQHAQSTYEGGEDAHSSQMAEVRDMCLARLFPDFEALCAAKTPDGQDVLTLSGQVQGPLLRWVDTCVTAYPYTETAAP